MTSLCLPFDFPSSPASSSLPFRPFSSLPTELIRDIVDSTSSSRYHPDTYVERQATLLSLCLTSRLFFQLAKPHLYAVVRLKTREQLNSFRDTEQARTKVIETRELVVDGKRTPQEDYYRPDFTEYWPLLATTFSLRKLSIRHVVQDVHLSQLARLKNLSTLHLSYVEIRDVDTYTLSSVEELCLQNIDSQRPFDRIFTPETFPALRVFSFSNHEGYEDDITGLLRGLEDQLDLLWIDDDFRSNLALDVFDKINRKTLFDEFYMSNGPFPDVHSYRLHGWPTADSELNTLEDLEEIVRVSTTSLPSVLYLAGYQSLDPEDPAFEGARQRFRDFCKKRNTEVVYESLADWNDEMGRSREFYRRMRGGKERE